MFSLPRRKNTGWAIIRQKISICGLPFCNILGVITTVGATYAFLSLMTLYPDKQRKLQQEVDDVIGSRLPRLADRPKMHYMEAVSIVVSIFKYLHNLTKLSMKTGNHTLNKLFIALMFEVPRLHF